MKMKNIDRNEFKKKIADLLKVPEGSIQDDTNFFYDLEIDSLKMMKLVNGIECSYDITVDDALIGSIVTFEAAYAYVNNLFKCRANA
jgi:acyl carrier protein